MFIFAILIGIYSYILFFLGITSLLYKEVVIAVTIGFFSLVAYIFYKQTDKFTIPKLKVTSRLNTLLITLILLQAVINFIGVLGPELSFDALWYHLTLPKLYLLHNAVYHIPGGLLYYSDMPKLGEMLYVGALAFGDEITVKIIHFLFGIFSSLALYLFSRKYFSQFISLLAVVIFYGNIVVAWESTTAYVDLMRTFYEILALWSFTNWWETKKQKWFYISAVMVGLAVTTKLLAIGSGIIFTILILYYFFKYKQSLRNIFLKLFLYWAIIVIIPLPWFIFSYIHTGNPVYPFFSSVYHIVPEPFTFNNILIELWNLFVKSSDPISPMYIIFIPLIILTISKLKNETRLFVGYSLMALIIWYFTPRTGGGRFILPYLPAFSILCIASLDAILKHRKKYGTFINHFIISFIITTSLITIGYRGIANKQYIPVIFGQQSKKDFLSNNLNFSYGDFYDTDNYFKNHISINDPVLLYGFHNLYYIDFPFIDSSWVKRGDKFKYIAVQNTELPVKYADWQLIYENDKTMVKLYRNNSQELTTF